MNTTEVIAIGDRVTVQHKAWYDGTPVKDWPCQQYLGTVKKIANIGGIPYALVAYDSGRKDWETITRLYAV